MKNYFKLVASFLLLFTLSLTSFAKETLIVGTNAEFAPFEYMENGEIVGFDIELVKEIAKTLDIDIKFENMSFDGLLPALQAKKIDIVVAGMTATPEREKFVNFTKNYFVAKQVLIVPDKTSSPTSLDQLKGKKVGVVLGYTGDLIVSKLNDIKSEKFNSPFAAIMALNSGKVDAVILDSAPAHSYVKKNKGLKIAEIETDEEKYSIAIRKNDPQLVEKFNIALEEIEKNGTYDKLIEKYFN